MPCGRGPAAAASLRWEFRLQAGRKGPNILLLPPAPAEQRAGCAGRLLEPPEGGTGTPKRDSSRLGTDARPARLPTPGCITDLVCQDSDACVRSGTGIRPTSFCGISILPMVHGLQARAAEKRLFQPPRHDATCRLTASVGVGTVAGQGGHGISRVAGFAFPGAEALQLLFASPRLGALTTAGDRTVTSGVPQRI